MEGGKCILCLLTSGVVDGERRSPTFFTLSKILARLHFLLQLLLQFPWRSPTSFFRTTPLLLTSLSGDATGAVVKMSFVPPCAGNWKTMSRPMLFRTVQTHF